MRIDNVKRYKSNQLVSFGNGKIEVYSDFDKTYFPLRHEQMKKATPEKFSEFSKYCKSFSEFFDRTRNFLNFHITTGRTLGETETIYGLIKQQGFQLPLPKTLIVKNGSDEYISIGSDSDFYEKNKFPFNYENTNKEKERLIKKLTNWDGVKIKNKVIELLKEMDMQIVVADSENSESDYGIKSLFGKNRLPYEKNKVFVGTDKAQWITGIRNDGNLKLFLTFPPDMFTIEERQNAYNSFASKLEEFTKDVKLDVDFAKYENECQGRPYFVLEPAVEVDKHKLSLKDRQRGLTKVFDTREAVKKALINNDLVIIAGDSSNDFNMLNMYFYASELPKPEKGMSDDFIKMLNFQAFKFPDTPNEFIDLNNLKHREFVDSIKKLPVIGIVMLDETGECKLSNIVSAFGKMSPYKKIIVVPNGRLEDGIKYAIKMYALQNANFASQLSPEIRKEIAYIDISKDIKAGEPLSLLDKPDIQIESSTETKHTVARNHKSTLKKVPYFKLITGVAFLGLITTGLICCIKRIYKQSQNHKK